MCVHPAMFVNNDLDLRNLSGYDCTLDQCDYVDADNRLEIDNNDLAFFTFKHKGSSRQNRTL